MLQRGSQSSAGRICVVTAGGHHPAIIINSLTDAFGPIDVIHEKPEGRSAFLNRRAKRVGYIRVAGQSLTMLLIVAMKRLQASKIERRFREQGLRVELEDRQTVYPVASANSDQFVEQVQCLRPAVILLCGCRMIRADILSRIDVPMLNYHAGITPGYRGMNGGYWALARGAPEDFGATLHMVDPGVDTGAIVRQVRGRPQRDDTIWTYAYTQAAMSREMCVEGIGALLLGDAKLEPPFGVSEQHYHPKYGLIFGPGFPAEFGDLRADRKIAML